MGVERANSGQQGNYEKTRKYGGEVAQAVVTGLTKGAERGGRLARGKRKAGKCNSTFCLKRCTEKTKPKGEPCKEVLLGASGAQVIS